MTRAAGGARLVVLVVAVASSLLPFYWMALVALSAGNEQVTLGNPWVLNHPPYLGNFAALLQSPRAILSRLKTRLRAQ